MFRFDITKCLELSGLIDAEGTWQARIRTPPEPPLNAILTGCRMPFWRRTFELSNWTVLLKVFFSKNKWESLLHNRFLLHRLYQTIQLLNESPLGHCLRHGVFNITISSDQRLHLLNSKVEFVLKSGPWERIFVLNSLCIYSEGCSEGPPSSWFFLKLEIEKVLIISKNSLMYGWKHVACWVMGFHIQKPIL